MTDEIDFQKPGSGHLEGLSGVAKSSFLGEVWSYHLRPYYLGLFLFNGLVETCSRCIESVLPKSLLLLQNQLTMITTMMGVIIVIIIFLLLMILVLKMTKKYHIT